jgi:hypothetical protein
MATYSAHERLRGGFAVVKLPVARGPRMRRDEPPAVEHSVRISEELRKEILYRIKYVGLGVPSCGGGPLPCGDLIVDTTPQSEYFAMRTVCEEILTTGSEFGAGGNEVDDILLWAIAGVLLRLGTSATLAQLEEAWSTMNTSCTRYRAIDYLLPALRLRLGVAQQEDIAKVCPIMLCAVFGVGLPDLFPPSYFRLDKTE